MVPPAARMATMARAFTQVDVFTHEPYLGNPVAVVHDGEGLSGAEMQQFASWTNLSETTFLLPPTDPGADYRVRIFTPTLELPFAGHPTLGSAWAWLQAGGVPRDAGVVVQQCGVGRVRIRRDGERLAFAAPPRQRSGPLDEALVERIAHILQLPRSAIAAHQHCNNGPGWVAVMLADGAQVRALRPRFGPEDQQLELGVVGPDGGNADFEVRAFFPGASGVAEDPVTGSLNAALAQWLLGEGRAPARYVAAQGSGRVFVEADGDTVWVGGAVVGCIEGRVAW
jgi:PhzF family phenazine biosynthesis protein